MKKSESIEALMSTAVASHSQRNQATLPGHLIFIPVFKVFNCLAKASGFCLYFYTNIIPDSGSMAGMTQVDND